MWTRHSRTVAPVELALQIGMAAKSMPAVTGMSKNTTRLSGECFHGGSRRDAPSVRGLASDTSYSPASDGRHGL
jgi:hypothetical protein